MNGTKDLKFPDIDKNAPFIDIAGKMIGLQEASRQIRAIQIDLREKKVGDAFNGTIDALVGQLDMDSVRQLVLNMFSESCGDDDEDAILKLLHCQSTARLHQLVRMPGTEVGEFDYNFDSSQWDDLEAFFAANGITLDP